MPVVFEVYDEEGRLLWDLSSRLGMLCGFATSDSTPGNGFAANLPPGEFFWIPVVPNDSLGYVPVIVYRNGRVTWELSRNGLGQPVGTIRPIRFYYGIR